MARSSIPRPSPAASAPVSQVAPSCNLVILAGTLSRDPDERVLPSGDRLMSFEVTTPGAAGRSVSVPVVWHDPPDRVRALQSGAAVVVSGRVQRRFFRSNGVTQSRTEVVAERVVPARPARSVRALAERAVSALDVLRC